MGPTHGPQPSSASLRTLPHVGSVPGRQPEYTETTLLQFYEGASWAKSKNGLRLRLVLPEGLGAVEGGGHDRMGLLGTL